MVPTAVAPHIDGDGQGLCMASAVSTRPFEDFFLGIDQNSFTARINQFMESPLATRVECVLCATLDLSNNNFSGEASSIGDFITPTPAGCELAGCNLFPGNIEGAFATRLRGLLNVTPAQAGQPVHIGLYTDDAASVVIFDKANIAYPILIRRVALGASTWRLTETVTFSESGLYPIEILYVEIIEHAALELSFFRGAFDDFERPADVPPVVPLGDAGFALFEPAQFFQTLSGRPPFNDPTACQQCLREFVNQPGNSGCPSGMYCNEAAVCAPCDSAVFCGPSCAPCGLAQPFCININAEFACAACRDDNDCPSGERCNADHQCEPCATADACAGSSCNCCPAGPSGARMRCVTVDPGSPPVCVECETSADCARGVCDVPSGHCVDDIAENRIASCCGDACLACPPDAPFCQPTPFGTTCAACRWDPDCSSGSYCVSGVCQPCTDDRRCGSRCASCVGDAPFCLDGGTAEQSRCVACTGDADCPGGACDPLIHECTPAPECAISCAPEFPHCLAGQCVECYADTHCPCGGTCDRDALTCSTSCATGRDCLGNQHCRYIDDGNARRCALGPMISDATCGHTVAATCAIAVSPQKTPPWIVALLLLAIAAVMRRRPRARRGSS